MSFPTYRTGVVPVLVSCLQSSRLVHELVQQYLLITKRHKSGWKRVWYIRFNFLVVLSQHVRKTGNPIRLPDLKVSCDMKAICNANLFCACAVQQNGNADQVITWLTGWIMQFAYTCWVSTTKKSDLIYQTLFHAGAREGLGMRLYIHPKFLFPSPLLSSPFILLRSSLYPLLFFSHPLTPL